jgi:putative oxidoreductase
MHFESDARAIPRTGIARAFRRPFGAAASGIRAVAYGDPPKAEPEDLMFDFLSKNQSYVLSIARVLIGINFATHGAQKLFGVFGGAPAQMPTMLLYPAGVIELVGGILIALGLMTSLAAFISSGLMAAGYFMAHATEGFWPIQTQGELAITYCWFFLYLASHGPGAWSLDALRGGSEQPAEDEAST